MSDRKLMSVMFAAAMGVATVVAGSASAAPFQVPQVAAPAASGAGSNVVEAQYQRRFARNGGPFVRNRGGPFVRHGGPGIVYHNGYPGHRTYQPGFRRQGNLWFPPAAFALGAIIGGVMAAPSYEYYGPRVVPSYGYGSAHVRWCANRYRSYHAWDNTFQPYHGPRRQCYSPYG